MAKCCTGPSAADAVAAAQAAAVAAEHWAEVAEEAAGGGGGGNITSVNGDTGPAVVLDASDVGADVAGAASAAQAAAVASSAQKSANLSDLGSAASARTNLGLGTAAQQNTGAFDASGSAAAAQAAAIAASAQRASNLSDLASAATARSNLGLGTAAQQNTGAFDAAGAATAAQAAAIAASLQKAANLSDLANVATARANLGIVDVASPQPADQGLIGWSFDPVMSQGGTAITSGTLFTAKIPIRAATNITNLICHVSTAGATLTAGQSFMTLHQGNVLLGVTADQSTAWTTTGLKVAAVVGGPVAVTAGVIEVGYWSVGTTPPAMARGGGIAAALVNAGISGTNGRFCTTHSGLTTTAPNPISVRSLGLPWWVAVS